MNRKQVVYPYVPNSVPEVKAEMLKEVGAATLWISMLRSRSVSSLDRKLNLPEPILDEYSIKRHVEGLLERNRNCLESLNFLGAGCSQHFVPAVCDEINRPWRVSDSLCRRSVR